MSIASAPSASLWLLSATALCLTACATRSPTLPPPPIATTTQWLQDGPAWAAGVLGTLRAERALRRAEADCLSRLRSDGVIR